MFIDAFELACANIGAAPTRVCLDLGISKGAYSNWKNGGEPSNRTKKQIADYFGVTVAEFLTGENKNKPATNSDELTITQCRKPTPLGVG